MCVFFWVIWTYRIILFLLFFWSMSPSQSNSRITVFSPQSVLHKKFSHSWLWWFSRGVSAESFIFHPLLLSLWLIWEFVRWHCKGVQDRARICSHKQADVFIFCALHRQSVSCVLWHTFARESLCTPLHVLTCDHKHTLPVPHLLGNTAMSLWQQAACSTNELVATVTVLAVR